MGSTRTVLAVLTFQDFLIENIKRRKYELFLKQNSLLLMYYLCVHVELEMLIFANSDGIFSRFPPWVHGVTEQRHQNQP